MSKKLAIKLAAASGVLVVVGAWLFVSTLTAESGVPLETLVIKTQAGKTHEFVVEVANTPERQQTGLMFRKEMAEDRGMLFPLTTTPRESAFWMKNTYISLDILFIAQNGKIARIAEHTVPKSLETVHSYAPVTGVLELNAGVTAKYGIKAGDMVEHGFFQP